MDGVGSIDRISVAVESYAKSSDMSRAPFLLAAFLVANHVLAVTQHYPFKLSMCSESGKQVVMVQNGGPAPILATVNLLNPDNAIVDQTIPNRDGSQTQGNHTDLICTCRSCRTRAAAQCSLSKISLRDGFLRMPHNERGIEG
jgi:hypothetical protein